MTNLSSDFFIYLVKFSTLFDSFVCLFLSLFGRFVRLEGLARFQFPSVTVVRQRKEELVQQSRNSRESNEREYNQLEVV
jgi:hypothetical protein